MKVKSLLLITITTLICACNEKAEYSNNEIKKLEELSINNNEEAQKKLLEYYEQKAQKGDADAQYKLGEMYYKGKGTKKNLDKAMELYQQAADQGHIDARNKLNESSQLELSKPTE